MKRLTKHKKGLIYYTKDGYDYAAVQMENFDVYKVLQRLAWFEDKVEEEEKQNKNKE